MSYTEDYVPEIHEESTDMPNKARRDELYPEDGIPDGAFVSGVMRAGELRALLDAYERQRALLEEYMTGKHGGNAAFMDRVSAELERDQ
jgi:hypothetical protein